MRPKVTCSASKLLATWQNSLLYDANISKPSQLHPGGARKPTDHQAASTRGDSPSSRHPKSECWMQSSRGVDAAKHARLQQNLGRLSCEKGFP